MKDEAEVLRIGKYEEGGHQPLKICFRSQLAVEKVFAGYCKLSRKEVYKNVEFRKDPKEER